MEKKEDIIELWFHSIAGKCIGLSRGRPRDRSPLGPPNLITPGRPIGRDNGLKTRTV